MSSSGNVTPTQETFQKDVSQKDPKVDSEILKYQSLISGICDQKDSEIHTAVSADERYKNLIALTANFRLILNASLKGAFGERETQIKADLSPKRTSNLEIDAAVTTLRGGIQDGQYVNVSKTIASGAELQKKLIDKFHILLNRSYKVPPGSFTEDGTVTARAKRSDASENVWHQSRVSYHWRNDFVYKNSNGGWKGAEFMKPYDSDKGRTGHTAVAEAIALYLQKHTSDSDYEESAEQKGKKLNVVSEVDEDFEE